MGVYVERVGHRIHLTGWAGPQTPAKCKAIVGASAKWDKSVHPNKFICWTYPLDYTTCQQFRTAFGDQLEIGPELTAWARTEKRKRAELLAVLASAEYDLPAVETVAPRLAAAMRNRKYQQVGSAFLARAGRALLADQPGLGKTLQAIGAVIEADLRGPILVAAPSAAVQVTWPDELRTWVPDDHVYRAVGNRRQREAVIDKFLKGLADRPEERHWLICNFEMCRAVRQPTKICPEKGPFGWTHKRRDTGKTEKGYWHHPYAELFWIAEEGWSAIIADESQRALVTRTPEKADQSQVRAGLGMMRIAEGGLRIAASGTPFRGKVANLWGTLNWLRPDMYTSYWNWARKWFNVYDDGFSLEVGELNPDTEADFYKELDAVMLRRTKAEVVPELPPKQYAGWTLTDDEDALHGIWLEMSPKQKRAYEEIVKDAAAQLESGTLLATGVLAEMTRLKQFASCYGDIRTETRYNKETDDFEEVLTYEPQLPSNKYDWLVEWLDDRGLLDGSGTAKVVIASQFTRLINLFASQLKKDYGVEVLMITGETSGKQRKAAKDSFQGDGGPQIFFLNTDAGGVSLTLDAADELVFLDEKWIPDDQEQVEDRIHRVSRMHQVTIYYVRSIDTIDETVGATANGRDELQKRLLDGRRGVDYAKQLLGGRK